MEFMVKTQGNDGISSKPSLMQAREFVCVTSKGKFSIECWCDGGDENYFYQSYETEQRRDKVFEQLETWIGWMIFFNAFGSNEVIMKEQGYDTAPFMIFEFPKE